MVGQKLYGDGVHNRREYAHVARGADDVHIGAGLEVAVQIGKHKQLAAARAHFLHIGFYFIQQAVVRRNHHHGHIRVHQRQGAVFELAGRVGFGMDISDFFEFQRAFQGHGVVDAAP